MRCVCVCVSLLVSLSVSLSVFVSVSVCIRRVSVCLSVGRSVFFACPSACLAVCLYVCMCGRMDRFMGGCKYVRCTSYVMWHVLCYDMSGFRCVVLRHSALWSAGMHACMHAWFVHMHVRTV